MPATGDFTGLGGCSRVFRALYGIHERLSIGLPERAGIHAMEACNAGRGCQRMSRFI